MGVPRRPLGGADGCQTCPHGPRGAGHAYGSETQESGGRGPLITLDHPAALPLYQKLGFSPVGQKREQVQPLPFEERSRSVMRP